MGTPEPIGLVFYNEPIRHEIRDPKDLKTTYTVVYSSISIKTTNLSDTNMLMSRFDEIIEAVNEKAKEILSGTTG